MTIELLKEGSFFSTRPRAHEIFDKIQENTEVTLDFKGVEATPSFLHETLSLFREKNIVLNIENTSPSLTFQLNKAKSALLKR